MLDVQHVTLRDRLRQETSGNHARVDTLFGTLDLTDPVGLGHFLSAHRAGFAAMQSAMPARHGFVGPGMLSEMVSALDADLKILARSAPHLAGNTFCAEALDHIVLGSRLGTAVLKRIWSGADDPRVREAAHYFSLPARSELWRAHTDTLKAQAATSGDHIIDDTRQLYSLFEKAFHLAK